MIPEDGTIPKEIEPTDITIATYVAPWAIVGKNKEQYTNLLNKLLEKDNSKLISVDPVNGNNTVRSNIGKFCLPSYYGDELKLKHKNHRFKNKTTQAKAISGASFNISVTFIKLVIKRDITFAYTTYFDNTLL